MPIGDVIFRYLAIVAVPINLWGGIAMLRKWFRLRKAYAGTDKYDHRHLYVGIFSLYAAAVMAAWAIRPTGWPVWLGALTLALWVPLFAVIVTLDRTRALPHQKDFKHRNHDETGE